MNECILKHKENFQLDENYCLMMKALIKIKFNQNKEDEARQLAKETLELCEKAYSNELLDEKLKN